MVISSFNYVSNCIDHCILYMCVNYNGCLCTECFKKTIHYLIYSQHQITFLHMVANFDFTVSWKTRTRTTQTTRTQTTRTTQTRKTRTRKTRTRKTRTRKTRTRKTRTWKTRTWKTRTLYSTHKVCI